MGQTVGVLSLRSVSSRKLGPGIPAFPRWKTPDEEQPHDIWYDNIHSDPCCIELDRDLSRIRRCLRLTDGETTRRLDRHLSYQHSGDERHRILLSLPWFHAGHWRWHRIAGGTGGCDLRAVQPATCRRLALDLRSSGHDCPLSKCLRIDRAAFPESAGTEGISSYAIRGAIPGRAARRLRAVSCAYHFRSDQVPQFVTRIHRLRRLHRQEARAADRSRDDERLLKRSVSACNLMLLSAAPAYWFLCQRNLCNLRI